MNQKVQILISSGAAILLIAAVAAYSYFRFGSIGNAVSFATRGEIWLSPESVQLGQLVGDQAAKHSLLVGNDSNIAIDIVGVEASCSCALITALVDMPIHVESGEEVTLPLQYNISGRGYDPDVEEGMRVVMAIEGERYSLPFTVHARLSPSDVLPLPDEAPVASSTTPVE